jgi:hypothetical protein
MRVCCVMAGLAVLVVLGGCAKPEYWVKGLTLPPGSTVVEKSETDKSSDAAGNGKSLQVVFECPGGFDKVNAHIGQALKAQGYTEVADDMGLAGIDMKGFDKILKSMKGYEHPGEKATPSCCRAWGR